MAGLTRWHPCNVPAGAAVTPQRTGRAVTAPTAPGTCSPPCGTTQLPATHQHGEDARGLPPARRGDTAPQAQVSHQPLHPIARQTPGLLHPLPQGTGQGGGPGGLLGAAPASITALCPAQWCWVAVHQAHPCRNQSLLVCPEMAKQAVPKTEDISLLDPSACRRKSLKPRQDALPQPSRRKTPCPPGEYSQHQPPDRGGMEGQLPC